MKNNFKIALLYVLVVFSAMILLSNEEELREDNFHS
jgi:hypothetical protein